MREFTVIGHPDDKINDTVTLDYERRQKSRQRVVLDHGDEAGIVLQHGERPNSGSVLCTDDGYCVRVVAAPEALTTVHAEDAHSLARVSYHLGNRHIPVQIDYTWIRYLRDHVLDDMIRGLSLHLAHEIAPFEPEPGAYGKHMGAHNTVTAAGDRYHHDHAYVHHGPDDTDIA